MVSIGGVSPSGTLTVPSWATTGPVKGLPPALSSSSAAAMSALVSSVTLGPITDWMNGFLPLAMFAR